MKKNIIKPAIGFLLIMALTGALLTASAAERKTTAVIGFINKGGAVDDNINIVLTRSLITFLSKIGSVRVVPYAEILDAQKETQFLKANALSPEEAVGTGLRLGARQVITGDYAVTGDSVAINVLVYNTVTGELILQRQYKGGSGLELFDTIDASIKALSYVLIGKQVRMAKLQVSLTGGSKKYSVYLNGVLQKDLGGDTNYSDTIIAGEQTELSIRLTDTDKEVFRKFITANENETVTVSYTPSGAVYVRVPGASGVKVIADGQAQGETDQSGELTVYNLAAGMNHSIRLEKDGKLLGERNFAPGEGDMQSFVYDTAHRDFYFPVRALEGGLGAQVGFDWIFTDAYRAEVSAGIAAYEGSAVFLGTLNFSWKFVKNAPFDLWLTGGGMFLFTSPAIASPYAGVEISYYGFFASLEERYSFQQVGGRFWPMFSVGYRL